MALSKVRLFFASGKIVIHLVKFCGFPITGSRYLPELQRINSFPKNETEAAAGRLLISMIRFSNQFIYDLKKNGFRQVALSQFHGGFKGSSPLSGQFPSTVRSGDSQVAFVITSRTRERLRFLGYTEATIKELKPSEALALVGGDICPDKASTFLSNIAANPVVARVEEFDMSSVCAAIN